MCPVLIETGHKEGVRAICGQRVIILQHPQLSPQLTQELSLHPLLKLLRTRLLGGCYITPCLTLRALKISISQGTITNYDSKY